MTAPVLTASEFDAIKDLLNDRAWARTHRPVKKPLIRLWNKKMQQMARIEIPESWDCEEIAHDDGAAHIEIVGKDNEWLRDLAIHKTRPAEDLHITIDPDPDKPHDFKNRWGGKVETIVDVQERGKPTVTTFNVISNRRHLAKFNLAATPLLPPAVQPIKMFMWGGPCASTCATAMMINLARVYSLNAWWPVPRNILAPETWLENLSPLNWPVQVMPINTVLDRSRWVTIAARWKDAKTVLTPAMKDAGVICHAYTWLPGDPPPYAEVFGEDLGKILVPTRACVILSFENDSGITGPTGTAIDGLINLFAATADDMITELLFPIDGDGDGETDPFFRKLFGVARKRTPYVFRDVGYGGPHRRQMTIHKSQAVIINTGGRSPGWVNQAITFAIRYGLSQLAQVINYGIGAYQQYGTEGLDNLYQGQLDDTLLAFINFIDPIRSAEVGPYAFQEHFETGSGSAFTVNSVFTLREGWWKTRPYTSFKFDADDSLFIFGEDVRLGSQVGAEERGVHYQDQILAYKRAGTRYGTARPTLSFGDDSREEDPFAQGIATVANVANFAALLAGSGDLF